MADQWYWSGGLGDTSYTTGATGSEYAPQSNIYGAIITVGGAGGTATKVAVKTYASSGTPGLKIGLYDSNRDFLAQGTATNTTEQTLTWIEATINVACPAGDYYVLVSSETSTSRYAYQSGSNGVSDGVAYASAMPASFAITTETGTLFGAKVYVEEGAAPTASITGTATASITEVDAVTGAKTIIITLTGDTWIAA